HERDGQSIPYRVILGTCRGRSRVRGKGWPLEVMDMEQIPAPDQDRANSGGPPAPRRLPGFTFLAWLAVIAAAACVQGARVAADRARASGMTRAGAAIDGLVVAVAVVATVAAVVAVSRRG
ncbi:MAG: hypothetical protein LC745_07885, partial [Planctomycetia bacterium]|nr:hypothetical protein [Planctomycetia bacterium]